MICVLLLNHLQSKSASQSNPAFNFLGTWVQDYFHAIALFLLLKFILTKLNQTGITMHSKMHSGFAFCKILHGDDSVHMYWSYIFVHIFTKKTCVTNSKNQAFWWYTSPMFELRCKYITQNYNRVSARRNLVPAKQPIMTTKFRNPKSPHAKTCSNAHAVFLQKIDYFRLKLSISCHRHNPSKIFMFNRQVVWR